MTRGDYAVKLTYVPSTQGCVFRCARPSSTATLPVEMVVAPDGRFLASTLDADGARRQPGVAHPECYAAWSAVAYGVPA